MKKIELEINFYELFYDEGKSCLLGIWNGEIEHLKGSKMIAGFMEVGIYVYKFKPKFYITDDRTRNFPYPVELQQKIAKIITKGLSDVGVKKLAFLKPQELISELSNDQTIEEFENPPFETQVFATKEEAWNWFDS